MRGAGIGAQKVAIGLAEGIGWVGSKLPGAPGAGLREQARRERAAIPQAQGTAQRVGEIGARVLGEGATMLAGGAGVGSTIRAVAPASRLAGAIAAGRSGSLAQRVTSNTLPYAPVDAVIGAGSAPDGQRARSAATNVAMGAAGASIIEGATSGMRALAKVRSVQSVPNAPATPSVPPAAAPAAPASAAGSVDPDEFVNVSKFALDPHGEERLRNEVTRVVQEQGLNPKQVITHDETRQIAATIGLGDIKGTNGRLSGAQMLALRNVVGDNVEQLQQAYRRRLEVASAPIDDAAKKAQLDEIDAVIGGIESQNSSLLGRFIKERSNTGRDLNALKILAARTLDPFVWMTKAQRVLGDEPLTEPVRQQIQKFINEGDRASLVGYIGALNKPVTASDLRYYTALRKAGLLLNVSTHARNGLSNLLQMPLETLKDAPATVADALASAVLGTARTKDFNLRETLEASARGAAAGVREARAVLRSGVDPASAAKLEVPRETNYSNAFLDAYTKLSFRAMAAADKPFKAAALQRSLAEQARVVAKNEGLTGKAAKQRARDLRENPTNAMALTAIGDAEHAVFANSSAAGDAGLAMKRSLENKSLTLGAAADLLVPFVKTPGAVAGKVVEYSPLGFLGTPGDVLRLYKAAMGDAVDDAAVAALQKRMSERVGRATVGFTLAILVGYNLAANGKMTPPTPTSKSERDTDALQGLQSDAVLIGDRSYKVTGVSPFGNLLAFGAHLYHNAHDPEQTRGEALASTAAGVGKTLTEQSFLSGTKDVITGLTDQRSASRVVRNIAGSFVPSLAGAVARASDPVVREPQTVSDAVAARIPLASKTVPARIDQLGKEVRRDEDIPTRVLTSLADPFSSRGRTNDPVVKEIGRVKANVSRLTKKASETPQQFEQRQREVGRLTRAALAEMMTPGNVEYWRADIGDEGRRDLIEKTVARVRSNYTKMTKAMSTATDKRRQYEYYGEQMLRASNE